MFPTSFSPSSSKTLFFLSLWVASAPVGLATLKFDFDDGTLQGWETILPADPGAAPFVFTASTAPVTRVPPQSGSHFVVALPWESRDLGHETLYLRSPEFVVDTSGDLTFYMAGGSASADLPAKDVDVLATPNAISGGAMFVGLRRVSDGAFVLTKRRGGNGNPWVAHSFTAAELAPYVGERCTLDFVDTNFGGWGWTALDTVIIPGVTGASVVIDSPTFLTTVNTGDLIGALTAVAGEEGDTHTFSLVAGEGAENNDLFQISGDELRAAVDFGEEADGTTYSVRVLATGSPSGETIESVLTLTVETPYEPRLVGFWNFNEGNAEPGAGGVLDLATDDGSHDGTMTGGILSTDVPEELAGAGARSLDLTGGGSHVIIDTFSGGADDDDFDAIKAQALSVSVWVKGWPAGNWLPFVSKNGEANGWQIRRQGGNNTGTFTLRGTSAEDDPQTVSDIGPNPDWSHLVGTYDGLTRKMFVDGVEVLSVADSGDISPSTDLVMFGNRMLSGVVQTAHSNVQLDDIGIWNYALAPEEIQALANGESPLGGGSDLVISEVEFLAPGMVRLTWEARSGVTYAMNYSTDLLDWAGKISDSIQIGDDEVPGDGDRLTVTVDLSEFGLESEDQVYFRISR